MALSDDDLEQAFAIHPAGNFQAIYDRYSGPLFRYLSRFTTSPQQSEEILHDIFVELLNSKFQTSESGSLKSWLYTLAKNKAINHRRKSSRETGSENIEHESNEDLEASLIQANLLIHLRNVEGNLPHDLHQTWQLRKNGLDYNAIASQLSVPLGTVKSRFSRIVELLRKEFGDGH